MGEKYVIIWIRFLARVMKSLFQEKQTEVSYLSSGKWDKLDKSGIIFSQLFYSILFKTCTYCVNLLIQTTSMSLPNMFVRK